MDTTAQPSPSHAERFLRIDRGGTIRVSCDCAIGEDHNYADWLALTYARAVPICELLSPEPAGR